PMRALGTVSYKLTGYPAKDLRWQFAYPLAYAQEIGQEASKRGLDPLLVHGLIRQESRYDPQALSRSKAMGLMQLLVGTAYGTAKHNGIALANKEQIFQPATNIQLGCSYLAYVLKRNNLNAMLAVASYNGGPNAVKKWVARHRKEGFNDMDIYVENIPYKETRGYVRKVFANYWNYESLYAR
ncbi:MAG: lytic transglycosylase domain-containing protein, partial [Candidatus Obscuribacterales bacterium]|nr:lytic transglycosylase domain-containing protein [Candidatus Obscuribacterales bacterium]